MKLIEEILAGNSLSELITFLFFTFLGLVLMKMIRYNKKKKELASAKPPVKIVFNAKEWWYNNGLDFFIALILSFAMFIFKPELLHPITVALGFPEEAEKMAYGFALGLSLQYVTHKIFNSVNFMPHVHDENCNHTNNKTTN